MRRRRREDSSTSRRTVTVLSSLPLNTECHVLAAEIPHIRRRAPIGHVLPSTASTTCRLPTRFSPGAPRQRRDHYVILYRVAEEPSQRACRRLRPPSRRCRARREVFGWDGERERPIRWVERRPRPRCERVESGPPPAGFGLRHVRGPSSTPSWIELAISDGAFEDAPPPRHLATRRCRHRAPVSISSAAAARAALPRGCVSARVPS